MNLAKALTTEFVLTEMNSISWLVVDYHFKWKSSSPKSSFNHVELALACKNLQSILGDGMDCSFVTIDFSEKCLIRDGVNLSVRVSPIWYN